MKSGISPEGIKYAVRQSYGKVAYTALSVRSGTVVEDGKYPEGLAHFVEHTIFKGTTRKSASKISSYLDSLGGELNAYTSKEDITFHATVLKDDILKAADLLFELATDATFPSAEVEKEKGVVIDEIDTYRDSPSEDIYDVFEEKLFAGHPLSKRILGTEESVRSITSEQLVAFRKEFFVPANTAFVIVAPYKEEYLERLVLRLTRKYYSTAHPEGCDPVAEALPKVKDVHIFKYYKPFFEKVNKDNNLVNCIIGSYAPSLYEERKRIAATLLFNILGGPAMNSRLNSSLRERYGWVYNVECNYTQYADTGIVSIILGCEEEHLSKCIKAVHREIAKLQRKPLSEKALKAAKKQLLGQLAVAEDSGEAQALSMAKSLTCYGRVPSDNVAALKVGAVTAEEVQSVANEVFSNMSTLIYL
ncbi:MAG: insulinase family protein [Bacteroidales bacterium]|nr:insulinase family protein [Bacteroidales bacterium]